MLDEASNARLLGTRVTPRPHALADQHDLHATLGRATNCWAYSAGVIQTSLAEPGQLLMPDGRNVPWLRFSVAQSPDERLYKFLAAQGDVRG